MVICRTGKVRKMRKIKRRLGDPSEFLTTSGRINSETT
jgi:hypothetical protein